MFLEAGRVGGLEVQLVFIAASASASASRLGARRPGAGAADARRALCRRPDPDRPGLAARGQRGPARAPVQALVFVGDCVEENVDELGHLAGELGLLGVRAFLFHEGRDAAAERGLPAHRAAHRAAPICRSPPVAAPSLRALLGGGCRLRRRRYGGRCRRWPAAPAAWSSCWSSQLR